MRGRHGERDREAESENGERGREKRKRVKERQINRRKKVEKGVKENVSHREKKH